MLVPGQVEKWITITNIAQFSITDIPVGMFKDCNHELSQNFIDYGAKAVIVNLTKIQNFVVKMF